MFKRISRIAITLLGAGAGYFISEYFLSLEYFGLPLMRAVVMKYIAAITLIAIFSVIGYFISKPVTNALVNLVTRIDKWQMNKSISDLWALLLSLLIGLVTAYLMSNLTRSIPSGMVAVTINVIFYLLCPYICVMVGWKRRADIPSPFSKRKSKEQREEKDADKPVSSDTDTKVIDSSALIDGRIVDICHTGFMSGTLIIPSFVVAELRHIADSEDNIKRTRGRRGLDMIAKLQEENALNVEIYSKDYDDEADVDSKLVRLAKEKCAKLITTNYNLNKAASIHKIAVLNINELANAIKVVLIPGETLSVRIVKEGKEQNQGVAYLDDGTMIVVENGRSKIGEQTEVSVTTVLQTAAGRMIFAKAD